MWPDKAQYRPGDVVTLRAPGAATVNVSELGRPVASLPVVDGAAQWTAPMAGADAARGFRAEALDATGGVIATTAFDVARHWSVAPRYGFLSDFKPSDTAEAVAGMNRLHLNVIQYYDWMYTHYQYFAPTEEFVDPLGRSTSHRVVQERVDACHQHGMACLAYGSLYGGEKPVAEAHPEWLLYDGNGNPHNLIDLFYIQNFDRGCGWRDMILGQYEQALERLGFDGIHIDQYGLPRKALYRPRDGEEQVVDVAEAFPGFIVEAGARARRLRPDGGNIFNCVNNWPVELVAPLKADAATYIEVWSPNDTYRDLHELVKNARTLGPHKQVILSAYLLPFNATHGSPTGRLEALRLATAAIYGSGGFHLLLGEGDGVLTEAYYPTYGRQTAEEAAVVQHYYDFITAYGELLHDRQMHDVSFVWDGGSDETQYESPVPCSPAGQAGTVWTIQHEKAGRRVLSLINLMGLEHARWNASQQVPTPVDGIQIRLRVHTPVRAVWCASPDDGGAPIRLEVEPTPDGRPYVQFRVPRLAYWNLLWTEE